MSIFDELLITIDDQTSLSLDDLTTYFGAVSRQQLSSTLGRLSGRGWLQTTPKNNLDYYQLTPAGNAYITTILGMIHVSELAWTGDWFWVVASLPESKRKERDLLRLELNHQGFGRLIDGLYLHPRDQKELVSDLIQRFGVGSSVYIFKNKAIGLATNQIIINSAWNWDVLSASLQSFLDNAFQELAVIKSQASQTLSQYNQVSIRLQAQKLVFTYGQLLSADPNLPIDLVPIKEYYLKGQRFYQEIRKYCYL